MRRQIMRLAGALALAAAPVSGQALAQAAETPGATVRSAINDLVFDRQGRIVSAVIGVGGFLGVGLWTSNPIFTDAAVGVPAGTLKTAYHIGRGFMTYEDVAEWEKLGKPAKTAATAATAPS